MLTIKLATISWAPTMHTCARCLDRLTQIQQHVRRALLSLMHWRGITRFRKVKQNIQNLWSRDGLKCRPVSIQSLCSLCHVILLLSMNVLVTRAPHPSRWLGHSRVSCRHRAQSSRPSSPIGRGRMCTRSGWSQKYTYKVHLPKMQCVKWGCTRLVQWCTWGHCPRFSLHISLTQLCGLETHPSPSHPSQRCIQNRQLRSVGGLVEPVCETRKAIQKACQNNGQYQLPMKRSCNLLTQTWVIQATWHCEDLFSKKVSRPFPPTN